MANPAPVIGEWYRRPGGDSFEVVAIDTDDRTIEIQYFDGTIEELELEEWLEDQIEASEPPEDWTGSVDVEPEDTENEYEAEPAGNGAIDISRELGDRGSVCRRCRQCHENGAGDQLEDANRDTSLRHWGPNAAIIRSSVRSDSSASAMISPPVCSASFA